jgi:hypothetical protein
LRAIVDAEPDDQLVRSAIGCSSKLLRDFVSQASERRSFQEQLARGAISHVDISADSACRGTGHKSQSDVDAEATDAVESFISQRLKLKEARV